MVHISPLSLFPNHSRRLRLGNFNRPWRHNHVYRRPGAKLTDDFRHVRGRSITTSNWCLGQPYHFLHRYHHRRPRFRDGYTANHWWHRSSPRNNSSVKSPGSIPRQLWFRKACGERRRGGLPRSAFRDFVLDFQPAAYHTHSPFEFRRIGAFFKYSLRKSGHGKICTGGGLANGWHRVAALQSFTRRWYRDAFRNRERNDHHSFSDNYNI